MIKKGDYLYCHSDYYHVESIALYHTETRLIFKESKRYLVEDVSTQDVFDPYITMCPEDGVSFLISLKGNDKCKHIEHFYTLSQLRERKLIELFNN